VSVARSEPIEKESLAEAIVVGHLRIMSNTGGGLNGLGDLRSSETVTM